jgi:hypothetical protein
MRIYFSSICLSLLLVGCGRSSAPSGPVRFIVPDGYRGAFDLILDPTNGVAFAKTNDEYIIVIPRSGQLRVRTFSILEQPHEEFAAYVSGESIPSDSSIKSATGMPASMVGLRNRGTARLGDGPMTAVFIVGTEQDVDEWHKKITNVPR